MVIGILPPVSGRNPVVLTLAMGLRIAVSIAINALVFAVGLLVHEWNPYLVSAVIVAMGAYVLVIAGMLRFTEWAAVRNRVSPARAVPV